MILTDAGPLVAMIDRGEPLHKDCLDMMARFAEPLLTSWPAFTEAMYLLGKAGGWVAQDALWQMVDRDILVIEDLPPSGVTRARALMKQYSDLPMDLADASLVAMAEERKLKSIFTLDGDFAIYRLNGKTPFDIVP